MTKRDPRTDSERTDAAPGTEPVEDDTRATRRRGAALEHAILDAAWELLVETGYNGFTFDAIAERAQTSKPVLYRRWPARTDLLRATVRRHGETTVQPVPDTGSLRGDVLEFLRARSSQRMSLVALVSVQLGSYFAESGTSPADLRMELVAGRGGGRGLIMRELVDRAVARGECRAGLPDRTVTLPFDLFRHELIMTLQPVSDEVLLEIVDTIFLPLVRV